VDGTATQNCRRGGYRSGDCFSLARRQFDNVAVKEANCSSYLVSPRLKIETSSRRLHRKTQRVVLRHDPSAKVSRKVRQILLARESKLSRRTQQSVCRPQKPALLRIGAAKKPSV